ncbi:hypothetical protein M422DRAFT_264786 [Sphaerobolus stellatus SS14]|uniref:Uncharacterized protein n=1 Tax=Sphaerobolus stellatus (strain SS14) TaxID=990650 RepID=A0A0C9V724_SPHS4|nr:hypothetical protein M422DRAFT_264786 [Sphaerobolus stellatus SS14]
MPDPPLDYDQLLLRDAKNACYRAATHLQGGPVASIAFPQQPIAVASTITSTSAPINNIVFPSGIPLTPFHTQPHHTPPSTHHTLGKCAHITPRHNSDISMDLVEGIIQPQCLFAGDRHIGAVPSDEPDDVFFSPHCSTPVISSALSDAFLLPSSELSSPPCDQSETPSLWFPDSPTSIVTSSPLAPEPFISHFTPSPSPQPSPVLPSPLPPSPSPPPPPPPAPQLPAQPVSARAPAQIVAGS